MVGGVPRLQQPLPLSLEDEKKEEAESLQRIKSLTKELMQQEAREVVELKKEQGRMLKKELQNDVSFTLIFISIDMYFGVLLRLSSVDLECF